MFSKSCQYAIRAVLYIGSTGSEEKKLSVQQISESMAIPKHYLAKILQQLAKHNIISSIKGPNGGFYLTEGNRTESMIRIIECIDGVDSLCKCVLGLAECSDINPCFAHNESVALRGNIIELFESQSIQEAIKKMKENKFTI